MRYETLGKTDVRVSKLCLGTMTFGEQNSEAEGHEQLDRALAAGINFIDTAEMYAVPARAQTYGRTETIVGTWLKKHGRREELVLATKVVGRNDWLPHVRDGRARLDRRNIEKALEDSLRRLQTDYVDLYQLHWPDRSTNFFGRLGYEPGDDGDATPLEETLTVLGELVEAGKVRYVGVSNETPWGLMRFLDLAERLGLPSMVSIQNPYSLLNRTFEIGLAEISHRERVGLLAYSPLAFGVLSGKYLEGSAPGARLNLFPQFQRYSTRNGEAATRAYVDLARRYGLSPSRLALAYVNSRPFVTSTIIGATSLAQLEENLSSVAVALSEELCGEIEAIHRRYPNPCP